MVTSELSLLNKTDWIDFRDAVFSRTDKADLIVAIARKMPRLLEYLDYIGQSIPPIVTERALPWISNAELRRIHARFCDDVLNVGTTASHYTDYALNRGLKRASIVVYARREQHQDRKEQNKLSKHGLKVFESFNEESYWRFETALPQLLLSTGKPYDLDFPIISLPISDSDASRSVEEWLSLLRRLYPSVNNLTTPSQRRAGVASFSLIEPLKISLGSFTDAYDKRHPPIVKIRLYIDTNQKTLHIVPMCIPAFQSVSLQSSTVITDPDLNNLYLNLRKRFNDGSPFPLEPLYNLVIYLISHEYGRLFLSKFKQLLEHLDDRKPTLSTTDLCFIFGKNVALELQDFLGERLLQDTTLIPIRDTELVSPPFEKPLNLDLVKEVVEKLRKRKYECCPVTVLIRESLRILDKIVEANDPKDIHMTDYSRLRTGFSLCDLWWIAQEICTDDDKPQYEEMSFLLDYYVDLGVIVPVVGLVDKSYCRVYRRGEADPIEYARFIHQLLKEHDKVYPTSPLTTTWLTKILAAQSIYHIGIVPLDPVFDFMGTVPYWNNPQVVEKHTITALEFLYNMGAITYEDPKKTKEIEPSLFD